MPGPVRLPAGTSFATEPDSRLFGGVRGSELPTITYRRAWTKARQMALTRPSRVHRSRSGPTTSGMPIHVAQRRCLSHSGGGLGRAQRGRAAPNLRHMYFS